MADVLVKVCGCNTPEAIDAAVDAGADYIGLNLYEPSPRYVTLEDAAKLRRRVPESVKIALVTVNMQPPELVRAIEAVRPEVIQFHGGETVEWLALVRKMTDLVLWKAIGVRSRATLDDTLRFKDAAHRILYDAAPGALPGGNGLALDWSLLAGFEHQIPWGLAGGLTPHNVAQAIRETGTVMVDAASGVESAPGVKDPARIRAFVEAARAA
ncbi:phosphoribosylanthranilate isomerase [Tsuneonella amylolytica]|uniref:phosphoribosylanthranilate isomerase n=1 Tax=Tsuneonella amylolytica TaxID=2338327 RepID=UPI000EA84F2F|nr:phosphoribosylanthranilate isomerase [Tsuneonella amylolytica]